MSVIDQKDLSRYIFGITGTVKEIIYPSKAIIAFKYNGKEEKAILLVHKLLVEGVAVDEHRLMSDLIKVGDILEFDGHIYDKGGYGGGKDRCNYYAMRAWKASEAKIVSKEAMQSSKASRPPHMIGTGWISEVFPRKGVLTFSNNGQDERVLFLASKVYIFEKRLGTKQSLDQVLTVDDPVQFEAVPQDSSDNPYFCSWFASLIWKGKKPVFEDPNLNSSNLLVVSGRRGSIGSTGSSESNSTEGSDSLSPPNSQSNSGVATAAAISAVSNSIQHSEQVVRGQGIVARIVSESYGLLWWVLQPNHLQSVWFDRRNTFLLGVNLANHDLRQTFKQGDPVEFIAHRSTSGPTHWVAKQVLATQPNRSPPSLAVGGPVGVLG